MKPTHDFLSLSSFQHNGARSAQGYPAYPMTHDFLQPLERVGKSHGAKGEEMAEKPAVKEHVLPGGIGTYSIGHVSPEFRRGIGGRKPVDAIVPAIGPEAKDDSKAGLVHGSGNFVSSGAGFYGGGAFTLWQETVVAGVKSAERQPWIEQVEKAAAEHGSAEKVTNGVDPKMPLFAKDNFGHRLADTEQRPSLSFRRGEQNNQGFMEMMKNVKVASEDDEDEEDVDQSGDTKRESSSLRADVTVRSDGKSSDQRSNTPRSKHSATEQRRRSKINDRFQILREIVPHSDQKRDKASFLLEVIDYIQSLQEKVHKYETHYQEWDEEKMKMMTWNNNQGPSESDMDHLRAQKNGPTLLLGSKFDEGGTYGAPSIVANLPNLTLNASTSLKEKKLGSGPSGYPNKTVGSVSLPIPPAFSPSVRNSLAHQHQRLLGDAENMLSLSQSQPQYWQRPCPTGQPLRRDASQLAGNEHQDLVVEDGLISVSSVYSQELLGALTQALQSSGLDLSQANIAVQINLGKRSSSRPSTTASSAKDHEEPSTSNHILMHSRPESGCGGDSQNARKRLKTERDL